MKLYIDPGTGSMLFTVLIGVIGASVYALRMLLIKLRTRLSNGKVTVDSNNLPFVIFSDDKRYWPVFEPVCREMDKRGKDIVYMTASPETARTAPLSVADHTVLNSAALRVSYFSESLNGPLKFTNQSINKSLAYDERKISTKPFFFCSYFDSSSFISTVYSDKSGNLISK